MSPADLIEIQTKQGSSGNIVTLFYRQSTRVVVLPTKRRNSSFKKTLDLIEISAKNGIISLFAFNYPQILYEGVSGSLQPFLEKNSMSSERSRTFNFFGKEPANYLKRLHIKFGDNWT